ncbi:MAG TPA: hypothetical protein VK911_12960, partial [Vicinamibacterales bacterium]|nr:hypothetical protein [Vicinamibacterales bacterium]
MCDLRAGRAALVASMVAALCGAGAGRASAQGFYYPSGEMVVADSERALQLFFFKHGISEPVQEP